MGDTWRGVETITKTGKTDQGVKATLDVNYTKGVSKAASVRSKRISTTFDII